MASTTIPTEMATRAYHVSVQKPTDHLDEFLETIRITLSKAGRKHNAVRFNLFRVVELSAEDLEALKEHHKSFSGCEDLIAIQMCDPIIEAFIIPRSALDETRICDVHPFINTTLAYYADDVLSDPQNYVQDDIKQGIISEIPPMSDLFPDGLDKGKVRRPANSFILFRTHYHHIIVQQFPAIPNNEISKLVGHMWQVASDNIREHFQDLAEIEKMKHAEEHPDYVYKPRKTTEKKRRMTRKKIEQLRNGNNFPASVITGLNINGHIVPRRKIAKVITKKMRGQDSTKVVNTLQQLPMTSFGQMVQTVNPDAFMQTFTPIEDDVNAPISN